jgi:hypothetical protein
MVSTRPGDYVAPGKNKKTIDSKFKIYMTKMKKPTTTTTKILKLKISEK